MPSLADLIRMGKQYIGDAMPGGSLNPETAPVARQANYLSGILDPASQVSQDATNWHKRTQNGLMDQLAGRDTPEAEQAWKEKQDFDNGHRAFATPMIFVSQDICYDSPIDGRAITSKAARMEDLARSNCVEYDPEMRKDADRARERSQLELEAKVDSFVDHQFETMPTAKREMLANELQSGIEADIVRKSV